MNTKDRTQEDEKQTTSGDEEESYDQDLVTKSLGKVGKGAGIIFLGAVLGIFFNFLTRIIIARFYTPGDYGKFNLYLTVLSIFTTIGTMGLKGGISRNVAYYLGKNEHEKILEIIGWGLIIGMVGGILCGSILFVYAYPIASIFSDDSMLGYYFRFAAIAVPFYVLINVLISIYRGFQRTKEITLFYNFGKNALILIFLTIIVTFSLPFENVIISVLLTMIILSIIFYIYYLKTSKSLIDVQKHFKASSNIGKELLFFSIPLLMVGILVNILEWVDTMMIGYYMAEDFVGFYQVAKPLSNFITILLTVSLFIYSPLAASLYAKGKTQENQIIFTIITKWICFGTLPIMLTFVFYPSWVLNLFFGSEYLVAIVPLQIFSVAYFINNFMGPNGATLISYGRTKFLLFATALSVSINIILNWILIPYYGIIGASIATAFSLVIINIFRLEKLRRISGIHPIRYQIIKPIVISTILSTILAISLRQILSVSLIIVLVSGVSFYIISTFSLIYTRSISYDDIKLLLLIEKKVGLDLTTAKRFLKKFI